MRELFSMKKAKATAKTNAEGHYRLRVKAFPSTTFEVGVRHAAYAPNTLVQDWGETEGEIQLSNIELAGAGRVFGLVRDLKGAPVVGAKLSYLPVGRGRQGRGRGRGWRGGRGVWGASSSVLSQLLPQSKSNAMGQYELTQLPAGSFQVLVEAKGYFVTRTERLELSPGGSLHAPELRLEKGAVLRGIVRDEKGQPVAGARVSVRVSMGTLMQRLEQRIRSGQVERRQAMRQLFASPTMARNFGGGPLDTRSDAKGEFLLEALPKAPLQLRVEKKRFLSYEKEPIEAEKQDYVEVSLGPALQITGRIVDQRGQPIENFGFHARMVRNRRGSRARFGVPGRFFGGRNGHSDPARQAEQMAREEQRKAERLAREAKMKARFGGSGEIPRETPEPKRHAEGRFVAKNLQPGSYVIDVSAPGYVPIAAGVYQLEAGAALGEITIRLEPGAAIKGQVRSRKDARPIAGALVRLELPPENRGTQRGPSHFGVHIMRVGRGGRSARGPRVAELRSNSAGEFELPPQRPGLFVLSVEAEGHDRYTNESFRVSAKGMPKLLIEMEAAASLHGVVRHRVAGTRYVVTARHEKGQSFNSNVDSDSGEYSFDSLPSGGYFLELHDRSDRNSWVRSVLTRTDSQKQPDLQLSSGSQRRFDLDAQVDDFATVSGNVIVNGQPGGGYELSLRTLAGPGSAGSQQPNDGISTRFFFFGRLLRARSDSEGHFEISSIPAGRYQLRVESRRGRHGGGAELYRQELSLAAGARVTRNVTLSVASLSLAATRVGEKAPLRRARAQLVLASEGRGLEPSQWRQLPSRQSFAMNGGALKLSGFPTGTWLLQIEGREGQKSWKSPVVELRVTGGKVEKTVPLSEQK
ncbi:MAG: hypothetical protein CSA62_01305 [Planctomycetota bacterium]|nr:MAG: hypothetical protein CSA62_01305 [Planctomycetota bacterium]